MGACQSSSQPWSSLERLQTEGREHGLALPAAKAGQELQVAASVEGFHQVPMGQLAIAGQPLQGRPQALLFNGGKGG